MRSKFPVIALVLIALLLLPTLFVSAPASSDGGENAGTGLIVPLYGDYSVSKGEWNQLIQAKMAYPTIPIIAIVNAANGSGNAKNENYASAIQELRAAHILVVGYVWTSQGQRPIANVEQDIENYWNWYGVDGIYFDQMAEQPGMELYYATLTHYAKSLGMVMTIGNPGTSTSLSYVGTVGTIVIYESLGSPSLSYLASWDKTGVGRENFAFIAYSVPDLNQTYTKKAATSVGYMFITDANNYFVLPSYLSKELSLLQSQLSGPTQSGLDVWSPAATSVSDLDIDG